MIVFEFPIQKEKKFLKNSRNRIFKLITFLSKILTEYSIFSRCPIEHSYFRDFSNLLLQRNQLMFFLMSSYWWINLFFQSWLIQTFKINWKNVFINIELWINFICYQSKYSQWVKSFNICHLYIYGQCWWSHLFNNCWSKFEK